MSFTSEFAVTLLDAPSHQHNGGEHYIKYADAVRVAHRVHTRRAEALASDPDLGHAGPQPHHHSEGGGT